MKTLKEQVDTIYANTRPEGGCLVTTRSRNKKGYAWAKLNGRTRQAAAWVLEYHQGPAKEGQQVMHLCHRGTAGCVTASHLKWGTNAENSRANVLRRERKLTPDQVRSIRKEMETRSRLRKILRERYTWDAIAKRHGVSDAAVHSVIKGRSWRWVK